jgi:hypothetical protein
MLRDGFMRIPRALRTILAVYLALAALYAVATPAFEVSDEPLHVAFAQHLADGGALPVQRPGLSMEQAPWQQEGSQPPLYYALLAALAQPFDRSDFADAWRFNPHSRQGRADAFDNFNQMLHPPRPTQSGAVIAWTALRFVGVLCGAIVVAASWALAHLLTADRRVATTAAALTAFNPMFVHIMASVNNDTLAAALVSSAIVLGARQLTTPITLRRSALLGLVLGAAALTKVSGLVAAVLIPAAVVWKMLMTDRRRPTVAGGRSSAVLNHLAFLALPILVIAGWWYGRNFQLYGDWTGTQRMAEVAGLRAAAPSALQLLGEWQGFYMAYWGLFGAVNIAMPSAVYDGLEILLALGVVGVAWAARERRLRTDVALLCAALLAVTFVALLRWTSLTLASQGRLLFPIIAAISALWAAGLIHLLNRATRSETLRRRVVAAGAVALAGLTLGAHLFVLRPAFALPMRLPADAALPADVVPVELTFDERVRWLGYRIETPNGRIGTDRTLDATLYFRALAPIPRDTALFVRVLQRPASDPTALAYYKSPGGGGMYALPEWRTDEIVVERIRIRLPDDFSLRGAAVPPLVPSALAIDVGFLDAAGRFLEPADAAGRIVGRPNFVVAAAGPPPSAAAGPPLARFERAELLAVDAVRGADAVTATLRWRASADFSEEYTVFVHVMNGDERIAQADGPALAGDFPARWWRAGDVFEEVRRIPLPADAAGPLTLRIGLYRPQGDFARMAGTDAAGAPLPDMAAAAPVP